MASQLLLSLCLVATLAVFAAASGFPSTSGQVPEQLPSSNQGLNLDKGAVGSGSNCDGTKEKLLEARDKCCNDLGEHGRCVCSAAKQVFDSVQSLHLCDNYDIDACSSGSWNDVKTGGDAATSSNPAAGGCSLDKDNLVSTAKQCNKVVTILKDLALLKKSSGDHCLEEALVKLGVKNIFHGVVEELLSPAGN